MVETIYLKVPKEKAASTLTQKSSNYYIDEDKPDKIVVKKDALVSNPLRAELTDHKIPKERIEAEEGTAEAGLMGTRVDYHHHKVKTYLSDYELY